MKENNSQFSHIPDLVQPRTLMQRPNEVIKIYSGEFVLKSSAYEYSISGRISFCWYPSIGIRYSGYTNLSKALIEEYQANIIHEIVIGSLTVGKSFMMNLHEKNGKCHIAGMVVDKITMGEKTIHVEKVHFEVLNLRSFLGEAVKTLEPLFLGRNRISLEDDKYLIHLDKMVDYDKRLEKLKSEGGFLTLYACNLYRKNGHISYSEAENVSKCLFFFLSFLNGRRVSPVFLKGIVNNDVLWEQYLMYRCSSFMDAESWSPIFQIDGFSDLWRNFSELWKDEDDRDCLTTAVHWYVEANNSSGAIHGSIVLIQNALELLYNWIIVEKKKVIKGDDSKNLHASNKIRLLLSDIGISNHVPDGLQNLKEYAGNKLDVPEILIQIRNAIVHSHEEKRRKLRAIPRKAIAETLNVAIWYVEMVLLKQLQYQGVYYNRCSRARTRNEEYVPWQKPIENISSI